MEPGLLAVAHDHQRAQQRLVREPPLAALDEGRVHLGVEDGLELLPLLPEVAEQVGLLGRVLLGLDLGHGVAHDAVHRLLVLGGEVEVS